MLPFELTKDTPYLALSGELWSVVCEYFNRNWPCYKGFLLYIERDVVLSGPGGVEILCEAAVTGGGVKSLQRGRTGQKS